ncbi:MAG: AMP-binding enzyme, partial [Gammaproteobacteria bacterium]
YRYCGRSDDMLKVGGVYVSPMEVENALLGHPAVAEAAVVGAKDADGLIKPKAFVVPAAGVSATAELEQELISLVRRELAEFKRPRWVQFVDELPKTATGKIQRFKLRDHSS